MRLLLIGILSSAAFAHSVPTHQQITKAAVDYLGKIDQRFACATDLNNRLQIGTEHEDDTPRFMFHFLPALNDKDYVGTCSSPQWGLQGFSCSQSGGAPLFFASTLTNTHGYSDAVSKAKDSNGKPSPDGWNELGYVLHLLEDLTSPAHTRNDAHPPYVDGDPLEAADRTPTSPAVSVGLISLGSPQEYFNQLQQFTSTNFYSKDTVFNGTGPAAASSDKNYFYDARGRRIAYKSLRYILSGLSDATRDPRKATIDDTIANDQFAELGPVAVQYAASLIKFYYEHANPQLTGCFIDFEKFTGPSVFTGVTPSLDVENATVSGGQVLSNATFLPVDHTNVYGTAFFCPGCLPTISIDLKNTVNGVRLTLMNGQTFTVTYTVTDDRGGATTTSLVANSQSGSTVVDLPSLNIKKVTVTSNTPQWDFLIDNVFLGFTP